MIWNRPMGHLPDPGMIQERTMDDPRMDTNSHEWESRGRSSGRGTRGEGACRAAARRAARPGGGMGDRG